MRNIHDIARHMGVSVDEVLELKRSYPKLFDFFEKEKQALEEEHYMEVESLRQELAGDDW